MIPKDPIMLLSWMNTQLRDHYASLDDMCRSENLERSAIESSLASVDYVYDPDTNQFT